MGYRKLHVVFNKGGWSVKQRIIGDEIRRFNTKSEAIDEAKQIIISNNEEGEIIVFGIGGKFEKISVPKYLDEDSSGSEPPDDFGTDDTGPELL